MSRFVFRVLVVCLLFALAVIIAIALVAQSAVQG